jgi:tetratricopeptide (TPR) repeat protein
MANLKRARPQLFPNIPADIVDHTNRLDLLIRAARQQCGGPYANWQDLIDRNDVPGLVAFASSPEALSFRSSLVIALSSNLKREKETGASYALLRKAVDRYAHDAWLHYELAFCQPANASAEVRRFEVLRHLAAASALRPDSALFHAQIGQFYATNRFYDKAVDAYRKAIALKPESHWHYATLAGILGKLKEWDGVVGAWREAARLDPDYLGYQIALRGALAFAGRHAEAAEVLAELRKNPAWVDDPRSNERYIAACDAIRSANGVGVNPPPLAERPIFRKQALALLTAELDTMRRRPDADRSVVYRTMQSMLTDSELAWVREPPAPPWPQNMVDSWNWMPQEEREAWNKLWKRGKPFWSVLR